MRDLFETGKMTEAFYFTNDGGSVRVTMTLNKCFDIRKYDLNLNYYVAVFETSSTCGWSEVKRYVKCLIN